LRPSDALAGRVDAGNGIHREIPMSNDERADVIKHFRLKLVMFGYRILMKLPLADGEELTLRANNAGDPLLDSMKEEYLFRLSIQRRKKRTPPEAPPPPRPAK
jgi:hypothetical protein